jgi:hypothetical protein
LTQKRFESIEKSLSALSSYSQVTYAKIEALKTITHQVKSTQHVVVIRKDQKLYLQLLTATLLDAINYAEYADQLVVLHNSVIMLKHHFLTFDLLPFEQANELVEEIDQHISESRFLYLTDKNPFSLYQNSDLYYFRVNETIHIGLKLKISPFTAPFLLLKLDMFSIRVDSENTSTLSRQPHYIAINEED